MAENDPSSGLTESLAAGVRARGIGLAYGDTRTVEGHELLPVAIVSYGFGASDESSAFGRGGGGGGVAVPIGAYVAGPDGARFRVNPVALIAVLIPLVVAAGLALGALRRR